MISQSIVPQNIELDINALTYQDCVIESGIRPEIFLLNFEPTDSALTIYDLLYRDTDPTTNSSSGSAQAKRNFNKCEGVAGFIVGGRFRQLSGPPIAFSKKKSGKWEPRRYHQPLGKPLEIFCPKVTVAVWREIAAKHDLPMREFPVVGIGGEALQFWDWVVSSGCPIIITEGEKKACCLISRGYAAICVPGITSGYRVTERGEWIEKPDGTRYQKAIARELRSDLQIFDTPGREITILFDFRTGDYSQSPEFKAANTLGKLFRSAIAKIAQLPGPDKGVDDFAVAGGDVNAVIRAARKIKELQAESLWNSYRSFSPDRTSNSKFFDAEAPKSGTITAIKSGMGTGKTEFLKNKVATDNAGAQINITYRNSLGLQLAEKLGSYHLDAHDGYRHFLDPHARLTLCIDSLLKIPLERLEGCTLIIDEAASVIKHLLESRTLFGKRLDVLERFELACKSADRIVLTDGHQADWVVNYIAKLAGNKAVLKIENQFKGDAPPVFFVNGAGYKFREWLSNKILDSLRPAVATDSLQQAEALAKRLEKEVGDGILLSSKTVTEDWAKEMLKKPDEYIQSQQPKWLVFTPTAESGVDISIPNYFSEVFCWFTGVLDIDGCMQMSRRVRHPERITIFCAERGFPSNRDGNALYYQQIVHNIAARVSVEGKILTDEALTEATQAEIELQTKSSHFVTYCKIQAKKKLEQRDLCGYLFKAFAAAGYQPQRIDISAEQLKKIKSIKHLVAKEECCNISCQQIFNAEDITFKEATEIEREYDANWLDRCKVLKFQILDKFPGLKDSELWNWRFVRRVIYEDRNLRSQLEAAWLFKNQDDAEYLQRRKWREPFRSFLPDVSDRWLKLRAMSGLNLQQFLDPDKTWTADSPEVQKIIKLCKKKAIANILGCPTPKYEMRFLNELLSIIGVKLIATQVRIEGIQKWVYSYQPSATFKETKNGSERICSLPENWEELSEFTAARMSEKVAFLKQAEMLASKEFEFVTDAPINDIKIGASVTKASTIETLPEPSPEPVGRMGWVSRWGQWVRASFLAATDGAQYRILIQEVSGWNEVFAWPHQLRWDAL
jgi:hypothetical protein